MLKFLDFHDYTQILRKIGGESAQHVGGMGRMGYHTNTVDMGR